MDPNLHVMSVTTVEELHGKGDHALGGFTNFFVDGFHMNYKNIAVSEHWFYSTCAHTTLAPSVALTEQERAESLRAQRKRDKVHSIIYLLIDESNS